MAIVPPYGRMERDTGINCILADRPHVRAWSCSSHSTRSVPSGQIGVAVPEPPLHFMPRCQPQTLLATNSTMENTRPKLKKLVLKRETIKQLKIQSDIQGGVPRLPKSFTTPCNPPLNKSTVCYANHNETLVTE